MAAGDEPQPTTALVQLGFWICEHGLSCPESQFAGEADVDATPFGRHRLTRGGVGTESDWSR
jgi:hypothetical protein